MSAQLVNAADSKCFVTVEKEAVYGHAYVFAYRIILGDNLETTRNFL
jgi:hypothetical protein